jgi:ABC-type branched-subunit amino acid transport system substrate-binding protein
LRNRRIVFVALAVVVVVSAAVFGQQLWPKGTASGVRIAVNLPLSGPQAAFSGEFPLGLRMGLEQGSAANGIDPAIFKLDIQDNQGATKNAVTILENHRRAGFDVYVSGLSNVSSGISPEIDKLDVSQFLVAFEAFITRDHPNRFRVLPSAKLFVPKFAEYARYREAKRVFMLTMNLAPVDEDFSRVVEPELDKLGAQHRREKFDLMTTDYRTLALKAIEYKPDLIMIDGLSFNILPIIQSLKSQGFKIDGNVVCVIDFIDLLYGKDVSQELAGAVFISPPFEMPGVVPGVDEWRARFRQRGGKVPSYVQAYAYETGRVIVDAYVKQKSLKPGAIKAVFPREGIVGKETLDADRDVVSDFGFVRMTPDGKREIVPVGAR